MVCIGSTTLGVETSSFLQVATIKVFCFVRKRRAIFESFLWLYRQLTCKEMQIFRVYCIESKYQYPTHAGFPYRSSPFQLVFFPFLLQHKNKWFACDISLTLPHEIAGVIIILSTHWVGCIFYFLARLRSFDDSTWLAAQELNIPLYQVSTSDMLSDYIICIYKGVNVLTALGYDGSLSKCRMCKVISPHLLPLFLRS
jgi:hypothetical protein